MGGFSLKQGRVGSLAALLALFVLLATWLPGVALLLAPAGLLLAALLLGFTPGERLIERMRTRRLPRRLQRAPRTLALSPALVVVRRVPSLAGSALAMRPPPAALALTS